MKFHPAADFFPLSEGEDLDKLVTDIRANGLREAIWLHPDGSILDGRNRWRACTVAKVKPRFRTWDGKGSPVAFVVSANIIRRHLSAGQRACIGAEMLPLFEAEATARQRASRATPGQKIGTKVRPKLDAPSGRADSQAAAAVSVSRSYLAEAAKLKTTAPSLYAEVRSGHKTLNRAKAEARKTARIAMEPSPIPAGFSGIRLPLERLRMAFNVVDAVEARTSIESSEFVRLERAGAELTMSLAGFIQAESRVKGLAEKGRWTAFADRRVLKTFLATAPGTDLDFFYEDKLILLSAEQQLEIPEHPPIEGYRSWSPKKTFELTDEQKLALKAGVKYLPIKLRPLLGSATLRAGDEPYDAFYFGKGYGLVATDSIFAMYVADPSVKIEFFLPGAISKVLVASDGWKIAADKNGVGVVLPSGVIYAPLSTDLDKFPKRAIKAALARAIKSPTSFKVSASEVLKALNAAAQFLTGSADTVQVTSESRSLVVTVDMISDLDPASKGKFERSATIISGTLAAPVNWPAKRLTPWLEYAGDAELEYSKQTNSSAFRFREGKRLHVLMFADG